MDLHLYQEKTKEEAKNYWLLVLACLLLAAGIIKGEFSFRLPVFFEADTRAALLFGTLVVAAPIVGLAVFFVVRTGMTIGRGQILQDHLSDEIEELMTLNSSQEISDLRQRADSRLKDKSRKS